MQVKFSLQTVGQSSTHRFCLRSRPFRFKRTLHFARTLLPEDINGFSAYSSATRGSTAIPDHCVLSAKSYAFMRGLPQNRFFSKLKRNAPYEIHPLRGTHRCNAFAKKAALDTKIECKSSRLPPRVNKITLSEKLTAIVRSLFRTRISPLGSLTKKSRVSSIDTRRSSSAPQASSTFLLMASLNPSASKNATCLSDWLFAFTLYSWGRFARSASEPATIRMSPS